MGEARIVWSGILPDHLEKAWPIVAPQLQRALDESLGELSLEGVRQRLMKAKMQLWMIGDEFDEDTLGVVITQVERGEMASFLNIVLCAGDGLEEWIDHLHVLEMFAEQQNCEYIKVHGRAGWERILKPYGYKKYSVVLSKPLFRRH